MENRRTSLPRTSLRGIGLAAVTLLALFVPDPGRAQTAEAVRERLKASEWRTEAVAEGVVWKRAHVGSLLGLPQSLNVLEIDLDAPGVVIDVVATDSGRVATSTLAHAAGAVAAVNGSFFDVRNGTSAVFFQQDGRVVGSSARRVGGKREEAAIATEQDGDAVVIRNAEQGWAQLNRFSDVLASGPLLVWEGRPASPEEDGFNVTHHPRTAVGLTPENHLLLVTVDGRLSEAAGMTIQELTWLMEALGCASALNLDGGGSTTMWVRGQGVVNYPSDNKRFDHEGERPVANAVVVRLQDGIGAP